MNKTSGMPSIAQRRVALGRVHVCIRLFTSRQICTPAESMEVLSYSSLRTRSLHADCVHVLGVSMLFWFAQMKQFCVIDTGNEPLFLSTKKGESIPDEHTLQFQTA